jgi:hypothetical protein
LTYRILTATAIVHVMCYGVWGQGTTVDLRTQARNVDFSGAPLTKTSKAGTVLPAACSTGETFFKTDAPAGQNLYGCKPDNVWSLLSGGGTSSLPPAAGAEGKVLTNDGTAPEWSALTGDVQGAPGANSVRGLQGRAMSGAEPFNDDVLTWNEAASEWEPAGVSVRAGSGINVAANSISLDDAVVPLYYTGSGAPQFPCAAGRDYYVDLVSLDLYFCRAANAWQAVSKTGHQHAAGDITSGTLALTRGGTNQTAWQAGTCVQVNSSGTALESAASACGSGGGSASLPATSGLGYFFPFGSGQEVSASNYNLTANKIGYFQFVSTPMSVNRLVYEAGTALTGGTSWHFALYGSDCATLLTSGTYSGTASAGIYVGTTLSPTVNLAYGVYYLMIAYPASGSPGIYGWNSSADIAKMGNTGSLVRVGISPVSFSGSWPTSGTNLCSGGTANMVNMPYVMLDFQ